MEHESDFAAWLEPPAGGKIPLGEKCIVGRARDCQVVVNSDKASRRHALIYRQREHGFWLADLRSSNGTSLNGRHVGQHCRLSDGDRIQIGGSVFVFRQPRLPAAESQGDSCYIGPTLTELRRFNCWLLVADMVGSTAMLRRLPDAEAARLTGSLLTQLREIIEKHQGSVNKFLGDGFLAYWPDGPEVAGEVLGALQVLKALQEQAPSPFRLVLHYGLAISGGGATMGEESLTGQDVTFAFRMEDLASSLGTAVLLSEAAATRLRPLRELVPQGRHFLAGFDDPFGFFGL